MDEDDDDTRLTANLQDNRSEPVK